jgi:hypothetical protein
MKIISYLFIIIIFTGCHHKQQPANRKLFVKTSKAIDTIPVKEVRYNDNVLEAFLDSLGRLSTQSLAAKVAFMADSIFKSQIQVDSIISLKDFEILKKATKKGVINVNIAKRIFVNTLIDSTCNQKSILTTTKAGFIPIVYYSFDKRKNDFNEYAICIGNPEFCENTILYFLKGNRIVARHNGYNRDVFDLKHFKDTDGKTVFYYKVEFDEGSGIWWYNFFFYKYYGDKIIPVLDELQNANLLQPSPWGARELWLESTVQTTNPLTIKMVYHQKLPDTLLSDTDNATKAESGPKIVDDSTIVTYNWNEKTKRLEGQYAKSKITRPQILSYYLVDNEKLFINTNYKKLKELVNDKKTRKATLNYLNAVKNYDK